MIQKTSIYKRLNCGIEIMAPDRGAILQLVMVCVCLCAQCSCGQVFSEVARDICIKFYPNSGHVV